MNILLQYIKKKKYLYLALTILFLFGLGTGILIGFQNKEFFYSQNLSNQIQGITLQGMGLHFGILSFLVISSMFVIGIPFFLAFFFIEGTAMGIIFAAFFTLFQLKGIFFSLIFFLTIYLFFLIGLYILFPKCLELSRSIIAKMVYKRDNEIHILKVMKSSLIIVFLLGINDFFLLLTSSKFLSIFHFLLS